MSEITPDVLEKIVNEQKISGLGLVTPNGRPHCTPVWVHYSNGLLYIFSKSDRAKVRYARKINECMIAFNFASLRGNVKIIEKGSDEYERVKDIPDKRYGDNPRLEDYKENWNVALMITPTKLFR